MEKNPIENLMQTTLENIKDMVDVNTVVGEAISAGDGSTIIPISKVSFGFVAGGGQYDIKQSETALSEIPFAGGSGAGVSVQPVGFLVVGQEGVKMLPAQNITVMERAMNLAPQLIEEIRDIFPSCKCKKEPNDAHHGVKDVPQA